MEIAQANLSREISPPQARWEMKGTLTKLNLQWETLEEIGSIKKLVKKNTIMMMSSLP